MTRIDIFSGFLGAGKTTLIKKMIREAYTGEQLVLIENEFGEIGIDGGFLQEAGIRITEMNSGCICCSLVGDFGRALTKVISEYAPDRILIEPSGVGKLSDVIAAVQRVLTEDVCLGSFTTVADAGKCGMYCKNFGEFYNNQIETASTIVLSRTQNISEEKLNAAVDLLRAHNQKAVIITTPWDELTGLQILTAMDQEQSLTAELSELVAQAHQGSSEEDEEEHHHHHDEDEEEHHHHHDEDEEEHHHHHDEDEEEHHHHHEEDEEHHHHHEEDEECDDPECECHHHHEEDGHHHHHHHHADEVFTSWGRETPKKFSREEIEKDLRALEDTEKFGLILRAKGIVPAKDGTWLHFDHVPGEIDIRTGAAGVTGRLCVIGSKLKEPEISALFGV